MLATARTASVSAARTARARGTRIRPRRASATMLAFTSAQTRNPAHAHGGYTAAPRNLTAVHANHAALARKTTKTLSVACRRPPPSGR